MESGTIENPKLRLHDGLQFQKQLLAHARRLAGNDADARDLVQDTYERALRAARTPTNAQEFRPWLMRVLNNLWIDRVRSARSREAVPFQDDLLPPLLASGAAGSHSGSQPGWRDLSMSDIVAVLEDVPEPHRTAFRLHALERLSYGEVARVLGVVPATVGTRILRARRLLRTLVSARLLPPTVPSGRGGPI